MNLELGIGIGNIKFGIKQNNVKHLLGSPDEIRIDGEEENRTIWVYNEKKLRLTFYKDEEDKLGYIETSNSKLIFKKKIIISKSVKKVKEEVLKGFIEEWEIEKHHSFTTHFNETWWITLTEEYNEIVSIELGVPFLDDETYNWPK
jgi:hypothetical protein